MIFSDEEIYKAVKHYLPTVNEYVKSHGGAIKLLGVNKNKIYIELTGTCHGCSMSLMTTKMVVQKQLRELIAPDLDVINVDGSEQNRLPESYYIDEADKIELNKSTKDKLFDKIKKYF
jgi:Fe-S cluster biogenesis protein NfuA